MKLLITGARRSGKSTALQRLVACAPPMAGAPRLVVAANANAAQVAADLARFVARVCQSAAPHGAAPTTKQRRHIRMPASRQRTSPQRIRPRRACPITLPSSAPCAPLLIAIDDVQRLTRDAQHGRAIRSALVTLCERAADHDLLIFTCPRAVGALPPAARLQIDAELTVLGGPFQLRAEGISRAGRIDPAAPLPPAPPTNTADLYATLHAPAPTLRPPTPVVRYEGAPGSGRTYALHHHPQPPNARRISLDCQTLSHKGLLVACLRQCGAAADERADIAQLVEAAVVALEAQPTLLLLDNVEHASAKTLGTLQQLLSAATSAALGITPPKGHDHTKDSFAALRRRAALVTLQPLNERQAASLLCTVAPALDPASQQLILHRAQGHPATLTAYAERVAAHGDDERHQLESYEAPRPWVAIVVLFIIFVVLVYAQRHLVENDIIAAIGTGVIAVTLWLLRPRFMRMTRPD